MNTPNPLIPQGSFLEQQARSRSYLLRIALCIGGVHLVFLGGLLMQGCKREEAPPLDSTSIGASTNASDTGFGQYAGTNSLASTNFAIPTEPYTAAAPETLSPTNVPSFTAPEPAASAPAVTPTTQEYTVVRGDSFFAIGKKFGVSAAAIARANPGVEPTRLRVGQKLVIPSATAATAGSTTPGVQSGSDLYVVKSGDTLSRIAREHGTTVTALREANHLTTDRINVGQKLHLPAATPRTETAPPTDSGAAGTGASRPITQ